MASFRDSQELEVVAGAPVASIDELGIRVGEILNPVDRSALRPKVGTSIEGESSEPELLRLGAVLGIEFTCIN